MVVGGILVSVGYSLAKHATGLPVLCQAGLLNPCKESSLVLVSNSHPGAVRGEKEWWLYNRSVISHQKGPLGKETSGG